MGTGKSGSEKMVAGSFNLTVYDPDNGRELQSVGEIFEDMIPSETVHAGLWQLVIHCIAHEGAVCIGVIVEGSQGGG